MKSSRFVSSILTVFFLGFGFSLPLSADTLFNSLSAPYSADEAKTGVIGIEDYQADLSGTPFGNNSQNEFFLQSFWWRAEFLTPSTPIRFSFLESDQQTVRWTFDLTWPFTGLSTYSIGWSGQGLRISRVGFIQLELLNGFTGRWFRTNTAPTVGTSPLNPYGNPAGSNFAMELRGTAVPEPGCLGVLAVLASVASSTLRRRFLV
jgi:hypothetical protein